MIAEGILFGILIDASGMSEQERNEIKFLQTYPEIIKLTVTESIKATLDFEKWEEKLKMNMVTMKEGMKINSYIFWYPPSSKNIFVMFCRIFD